MSLKIRSIGCNKNVTSRVVSLNYIKCDTVLFAVLLTVIWSINGSNSFDQQELNSGQFVGEDEAQTISKETNIRLAKIPCNFTTKINCIYADRQKPSEKIMELGHRKQQIGNEIVVSWVKSDNGVRNATENNFDSNGSSSININKNRKKAKNDFYNFNWIIELLACMMLASAFEICLLIMRNLRNISLAFLGFWSALNASLQKICCTCNTTTLSTSCPKSDQQRKRVGQMGEKRTLSYIFAILTWRASQAAKGGDAGGVGGAAATTPATNLRDETNENDINYGHVTTMGDLLLIILFTNVYYQRKKFYQASEDKIKNKPEHLINKDRNKEKDVKAETKRAYQNFYDKHNSDGNEFNNAFSEQICNRRIANKRCSHFCGNMYQQIALTLQQRKPQPTKLTNLTSCATKIPHLTYCTGFVWYTCCFCQYSCQSCYYCCFKCRRWNRRCYIYIPLCNTIYYCCYCKCLKSFRDNNYQYCCCLCCWQDTCHTNKLSIRTTCHYCCHYCQIYCCCFCNALTNNIETNERSFNLLLLNKNNYFTPFNWQLTYAIFYQLDNNQKHFWLHLIDTQYRFFYNPNNSYYQIAVDIFSCFLPQNFNVKWRRYHVAVLVMALIVICASSGGCNYNYHNYYLSLINKSKSQQNKKRHRRCRHRLQLFEAFRPQNYIKSRKNKKRHRRCHHRLQFCKAFRLQHYFYTALIQPVQRQNIKQLPRNRKKIICDLNKKTIKLIMPTISLNYESTLAATATSKEPIIVRAITRVRGSKPNIVWFLISLIWFEGPKMVNCNVITNYPNQQHNEQQQQQQSGNTHKETTIYSKLTRPSQRVQRALKINTNLDTSRTSSASTLNYNNNNDINEEFHTDGPMRSSSPFHTINEESHVQGDHMRLESIKHQILFKLGLTRKPNVSHPLPKQFIWDTIYRADGIKSFHEFSNINNFQDHQHFKPHQNNPYWSREPPAKGATVVAVDNYQQRPQQQQQREGRSYNSNDSEDGTDNIKRSLKNLDVIVRKKYNKDRQQQIHSKHHNSNDDIYRTAASTSKNLNELLYTATTNINKLINYTNNKTVNNSTILKESKHQQQFYKNSPHLTTTASAKKPTIHQQQKINNQNTNNIKKNINNNKNNSSTNLKNNNNVNNSNNSNQKNNNIIMVQKHLHNNNKYIEEAKKVTYLTDINSTDAEGSNIMTEYRNPNSDDNNSTVRKKNHHHHYHNQYQHQHQHHRHPDDHDRTQVPPPLQLQQKHNVMLLNEKTADYHHQRLNIHDIVNVSGEIGDVTRVEPELIHHSDGESDNENDDDGNDDDDDNDNDSDQYYRHNQHYQHRHDNYFSKQDAFDENEDFFGSTQEIITFAEKGKMYKNHRLVEFSQQKNEKPRQKLHVRYAEIHIRIDKISLKNKLRAGSGIKRKRLKIWIFQLIENNYIHKGLDHVTQFCASFEVDTSHLGWKKFDITTTVKEWYSRREGEKLKLLIDCTGCGKMYGVHLFNGNNNKRAIATTIRERRIFDERRNNNANDIHRKHVFNVTRNNDGLSNLSYYEMLLVKERDKNIRGNRIYNDNLDDDDDEDVLNSSRPFLVLHTEARRQRRVRRRAINCNGALHGQCCKESFYVSFKALGWDDWIIAPRGYFANYCRGDCTGPYRTPDTFQTFHAHFIEEYRKMGLLNGMQPCCAPIKFSSMSLIYYGDEGIIKKDLPKMVVDECGCP